MPCALTYYDIKGSVGSALNRVNEVIKLRWHICRESPIAPELFILNHSCLQVM